MAIDYSKKHDPPGASLPPLCEAKDCRSYWRRERDGTATYGRGFGFMQVNDRYGMKRWICQACYLTWADAAGISVRAKLLADPDSIPSQRARRRAEALAADEAAEQAVAAHDAQVADDLRWLAAQDTLPRDEDTTPPS